MQKNKALAISIFIFVFIIIITLIILAVTGVFTKLSYTDKTTSTIPTYIKPTPTKSSSTTSTPTKSSSTASTSTASTPTSTTSASTSTTLSSTASTSTTLSSTASTSTTSASTSTTSASTSTTLSSNIPTTSTTRSSTIPTTYTTLTAPTTPMTCDVKKYTEKTRLFEQVGWSLRSANKTKNLSNHYINCDRKPVNSFLLKFDGTLANQRSINYEYGCCNGGNYDTTFIHNETPSNSYGGGSINYLDRHEVKCPSDTVITEFKLMNPTPDTINYSYECIKSKTPLTCRDVTTNLTTKQATNGFYIGNIINLTEHNIQCNSDEGMNSFKFLTADNRSKIGYTYKCCK